MLEQDSGLLERAIFCRFQALRLRRLCERLTDERVATELLAYAADLEKRACEALKAEAMRLSGGRPRARTPALVARMAAVNSPR